MTTEAGRMILELESVEKRFGSFRALDGVSLGVRSGERIVICGPSGSGKSTLIRCVNGLERHDAGRVVFDGTVLDGSFRTAHAVRQDVGMVFQHFNLFPHLTVVRNCMLSLVKSKGMKPAAARELALHHLQQVRIGDQAEKYPNQLSGGQQQRVAIARALCLKPKIMLFDEPTSALDPEMIREVLDVMVSLAQGGMTMLCVTHEMGFARTVADRVIFMDRGQVVEDSAPQDFFDRTRIERAARFLNQINH